MGATLVSSRSGPQGQFRMSAFDYTCDCKMPDATDPVVKGLEA